ncbi:MAG TPA: NAD(P)H-hydrate dehydratase [Nitrososphaerales archaeon]|nr:NAD(P)H-hydrate dehydratase [Nitrososphaerales archaeon]
MRAVNLDESFVEKAMPVRKAAAHKRMNGTVCVVGGSRLYHGAPYLCASGAMRAGVDLVYVAVPSVIAAPIRSLSPDLIVVPLPDGKLTRGNVTKIMAWAKNIDCYAVGPGLGAQNPEEVASAVNRLKGESRSIVIDADALRPSILPHLKNARAVVTPHSGEFERLFSTTLPAETEGRAQIAAAKAKEAGVTVLLKGPTDVITDGERVALNNAHSPAMTVGGTGDVLTGVTAGLLAKGAEPFDAACLAAFINGSAGLLAAKEYGLHITASDVVNRIANVMKRFDRLE